MPSFRIYMLFVNIGSASTYYYGCWLKMLEMIFKENAELSQIDIYKLFED